MRECLHPPEGLESVGFGPGNHIFQSYVRSLVSFHVWACQPEKDRDRFLESVNDRKVAVNAAVLRSERYLVIQKIKQKLINNLGPIVQGHVQDGACVRTLDQHMVQEHSDRLQPSMNDYDEYEVINKTKNEITEMTMKDNKSEKGRSRRREDENKSRVGGPLADANTLNQKIIKGLHHNIRGERNEMVEVNTNMNKRGDGDRGMDIDKVLRTCQEAVQRNNASVQYLKNAKAL